MINHTTRDTRSASICWRCAKAAGGCAWSRIGEPIDGWKASLRPVRVEPGRYTDSYEVFACPEFEYEEAHSFTNLDPDGIHALAVGVLTRAIRDRRELKEKMEKADGKPKAKSFRASIAHLDKVFSDDCLWMQLAGLDGRGLDLAVTQNAPPKKTAPRREEFKAAKGCDGCTYWRSIADGVRCCHYYLDTDIRRPCAPGRNCIVRVNKKKVNE